MISARNLLHIAATIVMIWLLIGALLWMVLDGLGIPKDLYRDRVASGRRPFAIEMVLAVACAIIAWPLVAREVWRHPKRTASRLVRNWRGQRKKSASARRASGGDGPDARLQSSEASGPDSIAAKRRPF